MQSAKCTIGKVTVTVIASLGSSISAVPRSSPTRAFVHVTLFLLTAVSL